MRILDSPIMDHRKILLWADRHLGALEASSARFFEENEPYRVGLDHDCIPPEYVVRLKKRPDVVFPDNWVFMIGDAVHNMRVALDYLAFAIVTKFDPKAAITQILFPIYRTPAEYARLEPKRLGKIPDEIKHAFEELQPYHRRHKPDPEPLAVLDALENVHKHRRLLSAGVAISDRGYRVLSGNPGVVSTIREVVPFRELHDGAEIARYTFGNPEVKLQFYAQFHICFDESDADNPARGQVVLRSLKRIRDHIRDGIFPKLEYLLEW